MSVFHNCVAGVLVIPDGFQTNEIQENDFEKRIGVSDTHDEASTNLNTVTEEGSSEKSTQDEESISFSLVESKINEFDGFLDIPLCCMQLPVGNTSLLLRNCKHLYRAGVKTLFIVVHQRHADSVRSHLESNEKKRKGPVTVIAVESISVIAALREAREKELHNLDDDFFLMMADVFLVHGSTDLKELRETHYKNAKMDSRRIYTRLAYELPLSSLSSNFPYSPESIEKTFLWNSPFPDSLLVVNTSSNQLVAMYTEFGKKKASLLLQNSILENIAESDALRILSRVLLCEVEFVSIQLFDLLDELFDALNFNVDLVQSVIRDELQLRSVGVCMLTSPPDVSYPMGFRITTPSLLLLMQAILNFSASYSISTTLKTPDISNQKPALLQSFIGKDVLLGSSTVVEHCLLFDHVHLGDHGHYRYCIIFPHCSTQTGLCLSHSVLESSTSKDSLTFSSLDHAWITKRGQVLNTKTCDITFDPALSPPHYTLHLMTIQEFFRPVKELGDSCSLSSSNSIFDEEESLSNDQSDTQDTLDELGTSSNSNFSDEIYSLTLEALFHPSLLENKLLEIKAFRLASHQMHQKCMEPCVRALIDFLALSCHETKVLSIELLESCNAEDLISFIIKDTEDQSFNFLSVLLRQASSSDEVQLPIAHLLELNIPLKSPTLKIVSNPLRDPTIFCSLLTHLRQLDIISDNVLISWSSSIPRSSPYSSHLQSFAQALIEYNRTCEEVESD